jgi:signal peptidase I
MRKRKKIAVTGFSVLLMLMLGVAVFFYFNFKTVQVSGESMMPTLKNGQRVLVSSAYWLVGPVRDKDIIVIRDDTPTGFFIKRVFAMPGEEVNWKWVPESYQLSDGPFIVPEGTYYVLGDNRPKSEDSRVLGPIDQKEVIGKVVKWP